MDEHITMFHREMIEAKWLMVFVENGGAVAIVGGGFIAFSLKLYLHNAYFQVYMLNAAHCTTSLWGRSCELIWEKCTTPSSRLISASSADWIRFESVRQWRGSNHDDEEGKKTFIKHFVWPFVTFMAKKQFGDAEKIFAFFFFPKRQFFAQNNIGNR